MWLAFVVAIKYCVKKLVDEAGTDTGIQNRKDKGMGYIPGSTVFHQEKDTIRVTGEYHEDTGLLANL